MPSPTALAETQRFDDNNCYIAMQCSGIALQYLWGVFELLAGCQKGAGERATLDGPGPKYTSPSSRVTTSTHPGWTASVM